jgi:hypothetical protein
MKALMMESPAAKASITVPERPFFVMNHIKDPKQ